MIEDQEFILKQILKICDDEKAEAVLIAGDVFDRSIAPVEALRIFDDFLSARANRKIPVLIISGNHDSAERLSFGGGLFKASGIYISNAYNGSIEKVILKDEFGELNFYLLPFIKPSLIRPFFPDDKIESYTDAVRLVLEKENVDFTKRNVILSHQYITGAKRSESEESLVGGLENVDASVYEGFDYVALGHIHGPQKIDRETVRYCGTPLKYSFSEAEHEKSVTVVDFAEKENIKIKKVPLTPLREVRNLRGKFEELALKENYEKFSRNDLIHVTLTDEEEILDGWGKLKVIYPNLLLMEYDNERTKKSAELEVSEKITLDNPSELFADFFENRNNVAMTEKQRDYIQNLIEEILEAKK